MIDAAIAHHWTEFLARWKEIAASERLLQHFKAGTITRICECGCSSYDIKVPRDSGLQPLLPAKERGGCVLSMAFNLSDRAASVEFDVFLDAEGYLAGVDVACNANSQPVPSTLRLQGAQNVIATAESDVIPRSPGSAAAAFLSG